MTFDPDHELVDESPEIPEPQFPKVVEIGELLDDSPLTEAELEIVSGAHLRIMGRMLEERMGFFQKYADERRGKGGLTNEDVYAFNALANGIEDNISKQTKLKETHRKTTLLESLGEDFSSLVQELHKQTIMEEPMNEPPEYVPTGTTPLNKGELIKGNDEHTYDGFREENGMND